MSFAVVLLLFLAIKFIVVPLSPYSIVLVGNYASFYILSVFVLGILCILFLFTHRPRCDELLGATAFSMPSLSELSFWFMSAAAWFVANTVRSILFLLPAKINFRRTYSVSLVTIGFVVLISVPSFYNAVLGRLHIASPLCIAAVRSEEG